MVDTIWFDLHVDKNGVVNVSPGRAPSVDPKDLSFDALGNIDTKARINPIIRNERSFEDLRRELLEGFAGLGRVEPADDIPPLKTELTPGTWVICTKEHPLTNDRTIPVGHRMMVQPGPPDLVGATRGLIAGEFFGDTYLLAASHFAVAPSIHGLAPETEITNVSYDHGTRLVSFTVTVTPPTRKSAHVVSFGLDAAGDVSIMWATPSAATAKPPLPRAATRTQVQPIGLRVGR